MRFARPSRFRRRCQVVCRIGPHPSGVTYCSRTKRLLPGIYRPLRGTTTMSSTRWPPSANRTRLAILILLVGIQFGFLAAAAEARSAATIRAALLSVGFDQAVSASGARHLDADLTSWGFASTADSFVAAYYLVSELRDQLLGPLYISVYRTQTGRRAPAS